MANNDELKLMRMIEQRQEALKLKKEVLQEVRKKNGIDTSLDKYYDYEIETIEEDKQDVIDKILNKLESWFFPSLFIFVFSAITDTLVCTMIFHVLTIVFGVMSVLSVLSIMINHIDDDEY